VCLNIQIKEIDMKGLDTQNPGNARPKTQKSRIVVSLAIATVMLSAAWVAGLVIRHIRSTAIEPPTQAPTEEPVQPNDSQAGPIPEERPMMTQAPEGRPQAVAIEPEEAPPMEPEPIRPQMGQGFGGLNFNLTGEEQARLREGFMTLFQRFQTMSEEERQTQMARFNALRERFMNMSDQERQQAMGRVQQQIEQWRQNGGSAEDLMNNLSLD
jgi:hypothetical protein